MYYGTIKPRDIADGPGVRVSLFVSGCRNHCPGCFQPETWDFDYGYPYTDDTTDRIIELMDPLFIQGLTVLGGDPFEPENMPTVYNLLCQVRKIYGSDKDIWIYTGYQYEILANPSSPMSQCILEKTDVLVDGPFIEALKDITLRFRGSSNQRIIDVPASLKAGEPIISSYTGRN